MDHRACGNEAGLTGNSDVKANRPFFWASTTAHPSGARAPHRDERSREVYTLKVGQLVRTHVAGEEVWLYEPVR